MKRHLFFFMALGTLLVLSCRSQYKLTTMERTRIVVDSRYDNHPDTVASTFIAPYKHQVDSIMGPVMGMVTHDMSADRPESDLSNLLSDILVWAAAEYGEKPVLGIYNMGGIRASLAKGIVTYGDVLDVAPFENKIAFITLTGAQLLTLFQQIASRGGEGVSHGCELVINKEMQLVSARLHGELINPKADYRLTTIDYLLGGNDGMLAFKEGRDVNSPQDKSNNTRYIIMNYFKQKAAKGQAVDAKVEGRIIMQN